MANKLVSFPLYGGFGVPAANTVAVKAVDNGDSSYSLSTSAAGSAATVTPHFKTLGASASQVIPIGAKGYFATILTGTGTIGGEAVPAGVGVGSSNTLAATVTIATDSASSAFVSWET